MSTVCVVTGHDRSDQYGLIIDLVTTVDVIIYSRLLRSSQFQSSFAAQRLDTLSKLVVRHRALLDSTRAPINYMCSLTM